MHRRPYRELRGALAIVLACVTALPALPWIAHASAPTESSYARTPGSLVVPAPATSGPTVVAPGFRAPAGAALLGPLPPSLPIAVAVGLASRDPAGLAAWVNATETPGGPSYHASLTPGASATRYGAAPAAVRSAETYFEGFGLTVQSPTNGLLLYVQGPSGAVARAFGTTFDVYRLANGREVFDHPTPATLPAVAPWSGAYGLGNLTEIEPAVRGAAPVSDPTGSAGCSGAGALLPCAIESAYNLSALLTDGTNGTGETIAVVDAYSGSEPQPQLERNLASFATLAGVPVGAVDYLYPVRATGSLNSSGVNPAWGLEEALDLEWSRAIAPGATIDMTFSPNSGPGLYAAIDWLVAQRAADVISLSWGEPDVGVYNSYDTTCSAGCNASTDGSYEILGPVLELAAAEGISVFAASSDCGSADGTAGVATSFPASDPYVTGVGGTDLNLTGDDYLNETGWSGNEKGTVAPGCQNDGGSGGGYSPLPRPWWQTGLPTGEDHRGVPDVAMDAAHPVEISYGDATTGVLGTSVATPIWAGIAAIADQYAGGPLGLLNPSLYRILGSDRYLDDFHEILRGNNGAYSDGPGWNPVTGIGTPIVDELVQDLARGGGLAGGDLATFLSATPTTGAAPLTVAFTVTAFGGTGAYPLEGVSFGDSNASMTTTGSARYTYAAPGVYEAQSFVVDSSGNATVSPPLAILVGGGSNLSVRLTASPTTPAVGASVTFTAQVTGGTAPYTYSFWFGDGASENDRSTNSTVYAFPTPGVFCAVAVVSDSASPEDGGVSLAVPVTVGGGAGAGCGGSSQFSVVPAADVPERDAPADFPDLFALEGGPSGNGVPPPTVSLSSGDPYTAACECTILRSPGNYTIEETAIDAVGGRASAEVNVTVAPPLVAHFTPSTLSGYTPLTVNFTAVAGGGVRTNASDTVWTPDTGGPPEVGANVAFTFATPGEYLVTALLQDGGFGNASESFLIDAEAPEGRSSVGVIATIEPSEHVSAGASVSYWAEATRSVGPTTILWGLGNGGSAFAPPPPPSGKASVTATYFALPSSDILPVNLTVFGPGYVPLVDVALPLPQFLAVEAAAFVPKADALSETLRSTPGEGVVPLPVSATATVSGPGLSASSTAVMTFGDGTLASGGVVDHTYPSAGNYTLEASVTDPYNDSATIERAETVFPTIRLVGGPVPSSGSAPLTVSFDVNVTGGAGGPYEYQWTFGNGATSTAAEPTERYAHPGRYTVSLTVEDAAADAVRENWTVVVRLPDWVEPAIVGAAAAVGVGLGLAAVLGGTSRRRQAPPTPPPPSP